MILWTIQEENAYEQLVNTGVYRTRSQSFDYTKWQREHYDKITPEELYESLKEYSKTHEFQGAKAKII